MRSFYFRIFMSFYIGTGIQLIAMAMVGLCFLSGVTKGDYGRIELIQLVGGLLIFYVGQYFRSRHRG